MDSGRVYNDTHMAANVLLKNERLPCSSQVLDSLWVPDSAPIFHGSTGMMKFEDMRGENNIERPFFTHIDSTVENGNENFDGCFHQPEKKRRLLPDQVQFLEKSFEVENKLEPERKVQLAKDLGLQPRQVAIWFQNRRARYKTKHLEKEYDILKASYDKLKADYSTLYKENEKLREEVQLLSEKVLGKPKQEPFDSITTPLDAESKKLIFTPNAVLDASSSAKSDDFDSDSPHCTDGNHSTLLEPTDSSHHSDFSQDEDDNLSRNLLPPSYFPKLEIECYDDLQPNSCSLGFPIQDQGSWFWPY